MQWFEDEEFWSLLYPRLFRDRHFEAAPEEVDRVLTLSGVRKGVVLDLCCGPARHSVAFAEKGFDVTGVDRSSFLLKKARERSTGVDIDFIQCDAREFVREHAFDLAISLYTSFGYFETRAEDLQVLKNVCRSLRPGGVFVIDVFGRECLAAKPCHTHWEKYPDGSIFIEHNEILPGWTRVHNQWLLVRGDHARRFDFDLSVYSGQELREALEKAGFSQVEIFGSLAGIPYDGNATRLVARAVAADRKTKTEEAPFALPPC